MLSIKSDVQINGNLALFKYTFVQKYKRFHIKQKKKIENKNNKKF